MVHLPHGNWCLEMYKELEIATFKTLKLVSIKDITKISVYGIVDLGTGYTYCVSATT